MFAFKRNQVIISALVVMIAVAGYLNYVDSLNGTGKEILLNDQGEIMALIPNIDETVPVSAVQQVENVGKGIGTALTIDDNPEILTAETMKNVDTVAVANLEEQEANVTNINDIDVPTGEAVFVNNTNDSSYFVQAKLEREQSRAKQKDILTEMINNDSLDQTKKAEVADQMLSIQKRIEKETAAEAMIEAKGFKEVYVRIDDDTVDVVVNKESLTEAETAQIEDIVKRKTGMDTTQIRISTMKK